MYSLRSWRDFARECFCFGSEKAVRGLVKSRVDAAREIPRWASPAREYGGSAADRPLTNPAS